MCLGAARAVELLAPVKRCEAGWIDRYMAAHLRGQSYLTAHRGQDAALEFQKIVDHRGIVLTSIIGALSQVGLARAFLLQGDIPRTRATYETSSGLEGSGQGRTCIGRCQIRIRKLR